MTLDEAIAHAKEVAKAQRDELILWEHRKEIIESNESNPKNLYDLPIAKCTECAKEHEQLAEWLEELKRYNAQKFVIKVDYNKAPALKELLRHSQFGMAYPDGQYEVVPFALS